MNKVAVRGQLPMSSTYSGHIGNERINFDDGVYDTEYYTRMNLWKYNPLLYSSNKPKSKMDSKHNDVQIGVTPNVSLPEKAAEEKAEMKEKIKNIRREVIGSEEAIPLSSTSKDTHDSSTNTMDATQGDSFILRLESSSDQSTNSTSESLQEESK